MKVRKWIWALFICSLLVLFVQGVRFVGQHVNVQSSLSAILPDYNTMGEEAFRTRVVAVLTQVGVDLKPSDVHIVEDRKASRLTVDLTYRHDLWILFYKMEKRMRVKQDAVLIEL